jgi:threonine/homoserine/homoserine lactone efflux protein
MGIVWLGSLSVAAAGGRRWMQNPSVRAGVSRVSGVILVGLGVRLALERR